MAGGSVTFQAQNPAISGDPSTHLNAHGVRVKSGWSNCTAFVAAMGAQFDAGIRLTGTQVRKESSEPIPDSQSPGLSLVQVAAVLKRHGVRISVRTPIDFDDLDAARIAGHAIGLQLSYEPIQHTKFTGDPAFDGGHIVLWLPNGDVLDPLHDHRRAGIARAPVRMPRAVLREAAGKLQLGGGRRVGLGLAYAAVFPTRHPAGSTGGHATVHATPAGPAHGPAVAVSAKAGAAFRVVVPVGLVRTSPAGVPGKGNVVGRLKLGARVAVFGTTQHGQRVGGSRVWHQVDRGGRRFMHSSVIDPLAPTRGLPDEELEDVLPAGVDAPDAPGPDQDADLDGPFDDEVSRNPDDDLEGDEPIDDGGSDPAEPPPKNDAVPEESEDPAAAPQG